MRILGIDPGLNTTGYGVLDFAAGRPRLVEAGVVRSSARRTLAERVQEIHDGVADVIMSLKAEVLAVEELYTHYDRPTTAILMGHARGVILLAAAGAGIAVESYPSTQIKKTITGNGHAPKWQMQEAIRRELNLPTVPEPPDVADALAIALCHGYLHRMTRIDAPHNSIEPLAPADSGDCGLRIEERQSALRDPKSAIRDPTP